jgi:fibro-slime domain-containing protein
MMGFNKVKALLLSIAFLPLASTMATDLTNPGDFDELCRCVDPFNGVRQIPVLIRDFKESHPDFEGGIFGYDKNIVEKTIGADGRPVYAGETFTTHGKESFDQWYKSIPGLNFPINQTLPMTEVAPGLYRYTNFEFFPIDGEGFGNQGYSHNYHFTLETHLKFFYVEGGQFTFNGDDDLWIFINGKLAIDLGGVHGREEKTVYLDTLAEELGIEPNNSYSFDLFFAERHSVHSAFQFETTFELQCL